MVSTWLTSAQAAALIGVHPSWVRYLCRTGILRSRQIGRAHLIDRRSAEDYRDTPRQVGRPKTRA